MSIDVYLMRHGQALSERLDPKRPLSEDGQDEVRLMASFLAGLGVQVRTIEHSTKARARETAEIVAAALDPRPTLRERPGLAPEDDPEIARQGLQTGGESAFLVGHLPHLDRLAASLVGARPPASLLDLATGQVVCVRREGRHWTIRWTINPWTLARGAAPDR